MAQQYIGARISLISKSDIRYRGILHSIDPAASTVSLEQVRSMGTEGRKSNPAEEIAPTDTLYEFIVFRAADVKDLSIEAAAESKLEPPKPSVPDDPAIMSTTAPPRHTPATNPYMAQHPMQPPQGMYPPPMMYGPGGMPPQWPAYGMPPPPPGQIHPMMGFPPQPLAPPPVSAPQAQTQAQPADPSSPPKSSAPPVSAIDRPTSQAKTTPKTGATVLPAKPAAAPSVTPTPSTGLAAKSPAPINGTTPKSVRVNEPKPTHPPASAKTPQPQTQPQPPSQATSSQPASSANRTQALKQPVRHPLPQAPKVAAQAPDFDFASSNAKFPEVPKEDDFVIPEAPPGTYYDKKKSFFDDISSEVKERSAEASPRGGGGGGANGRGGRGGRGWDRNAERQKNVDTFGDVALNPNLGALGSGYNGYGRGGVNKMGGGGYRGMGRGGGGGRGGGFQPRGMGRGGVPFHRS
ncbi:hypothetical protein CROQUDRAFT_104230 [Cronartium quercuum f. sp. fusiforme G11]|uniref:Uncharacterized protein n=1 Tax=Cronartium quercuum f. sp. fusiforme G11 TaxID=708437 RepID=A0A9P6NW13_9BASI|nr:hypothetical protein CROQUDRAFT_104230 [Cronartium quercuum f. sp. fusiforme G11]